MRSGSDASTCNAVYHYSSWELRETECQPPGPIANWRSLAVTAWHERHIGSRSLTDRDSVDTHPTTDHYIQTKDRANLLGP